MTRLVLEPRVRRPQPDLLIGGTPYRLLRLSAQGTAALDALLAGRPHPGATALERRLLKAGMALRGAGPSRRADVSVVVPARASAEDVGRTIAGIPTDVTVIVIDDASLAPLKGALPRHPGLTVQRLEPGRGAGAARNAGAGRVTTPVVAFIDADVELAPGWLDRLSGHFAYDDVVAVAPRIRSRAASGLVDLLERDLCALDLGPEPADVRRGARVSYLPSTVLLVRRTAFEDVGGFDPALAVGEDVDLVWRLQAQGSVRYDPDEVAWHGARRSLRAALRRRWDYGTCAGPLDRRHPGRLRHLLVSVWSAAPWVAALAHPAAGAGTAAALIGFAPRGMPTLPPAEARRLAAAGQWNGAKALARYALRPGWPVTAAALVASPRFRRLAPALAVAYLATTSADVVRVPVRHVPARLGLRLLDDLVYSGGVWRSCIAERRLGPLVPYFTH